jgi:hypothetical protein
VVMRVLSEKSTDTASPPPQSLASQVPGRRALFLFSGRESPSETLFSEAATIAADGFATEALFSFSFKRFFRPETILTRMPRGCIHVDASCEMRLTAHVESASVVVASALSLNTMAKLAAGIDDSVPLFALSTALRRGAPVFVGSDTQAIETALAGLFSTAAPAVLRLAVDNLHRVRGLGVRFVPGEQLAAEVAAAFRVVPNETPERLARVRQPLKHEFITAEDVWKARAAGLKQLRLPPLAVVTDEAREKAAREGIELVGE